MISMNEANMKQNNIKKVISYLYLNFCRPVFTLETLQLFSSNYL